MLVLISSTKLLATGNLARDGLIKMVSVYCGICTLNYRYRSDTTGIGIDTDTGIGIGPPLIRMHDLDFAMKTTQTDSVLLCLPSYELKMLG